MKKLMLFAILGVFAACFAFAQSEQPAQQQPGAYPEQQPAASDSKHMSSSSFHGTIDSVDVTAKTFTVKMDKTEETKTFSFDDKTKWEAKDKMFKADNLKAGDRVTIQADASNLATKIKVKEATAEKQ
jgi:uncharacterized protein DUF5666